jgi:ATPases involved in chromosome partitioning
MKKIIFITQSKGGVGKSVLSFLYGQKFAESAVFLDLDDATSTTLKQLAYLQPKQVSFLNESKNIDRGLYNNFLEYISVHEKNTFICDLGASISEQLPYYINDFSATALKSALDAMQIELTIICVVGGQNIFVACMDYLEGLATACDNQIKIKVAVNDHFLLNETQQQEFAAFCKALRLKDTFRFNLSRDKNAATQQRVNDILKSGTGLQNASIITKELFRLSIQNLPAL